MAKKFVLRIVDETMYEKLDKVAKEDLTSVNTLINNVLKNYLKKLKKN
jgi:hypothetical protein